MDLRFKLDENIPRRVESGLRDVGNDVETARSEGFAGALDPHLVAACIAEDRILVTLDLDFADIRTYPPGSHRGVWVLRPAETSKVESRTPAKLGDAQAGLKASHQRPDADRVQAIADTGLLMGSVRSLGSNSYPRMPR